MIKCRYSLIFLQLRPRVFDATHCLRPKDRMDESDFDALDIGDVV